MNPRIGLLGSLLAAIALAGCPETAHPGDGGDSGDAMVVDAMDTPVADAPVDVMDAGPATIGNPCTGAGTPAPAQGDCPDGQICLDEAQGFPNGYCIQDCGGGAACPMGSRCTVLGGQFSLCLRTCESDQDCREEEGYACTPTMSGGRVCLPGDAPVGDRNGMPCYTTTAGAHQLPALGHTTFAAPNLSVSEARTDTSFEAEGNIAISPTTGNVTLGYIAEARGGAFMGTSTTADGTSVMPNGTVRDPMLATTSDPVLAYTADGTLHMVFLGYNVNNAGQPTGMRVRVADSMDDGNTWMPARAIEPTTFCSQGCDKPWITVGPGPDGTGEVIYVGWLQETRTAANLVIESSSDGGATWSTPHTFANGPQSLDGSSVVPNLQTLVVGTDGVLHATYVGLSSTSMTANYGSTQNRVAYRRSSDGGVTWGSVRRVSALTDSPVYEQPMIGVDGQTVYIAYTSGDPDGAWDIVLATSPDGGTSWSYRKVNDEPDRCATHAFPALIADPVRHVAHITWLENRFGDGALAYSSCPQDGTANCASNEQVSDASFTFTTSRDPSIWHGDYMGLTLSSSGDLWAGWSDTRAGGPHMFMAHGMPH